MYEDTTTLGLLFLATLVACAFGGYLLGSISFGLIATRLAKTEDIRSIGSGSIGATNVLRTGRRDLAAITLVGDAGKGAVAVLLATWLVSPLGGVIAGGGAFLGHLFSVWLRFRGGKGVATFYGILFAVFWPVGLIAGAVWLAVAAIFRFSSLAGLSAAISAPIAMYLLRPGRMDAVWLTIFMAVLIFIRHRANIERLLKGAEPRIGAAKASAA
jgi:glycerol-3-phosphate acyltransferase PlsY